MAFWDTAQPARGAAARTIHFGHGGGEDAAGGDADEPRRDWKKLFLVAGLGALSWVATYVGMLELIEANMGDLPLVHKLIIGFSVAMLMTMIIWLLDQLFAPIPVPQKIVYAGGYVFLSLISVGFGFGFYWKVLESRAESSRSAESAVTQVQASLHGASTRLEQLSATLVQLTQVSSAQAEVERTKGTSCPNSKPGDGPRRKLREDDAARFTFASEFVKGRVAQVKGDLAALDADLAKIASNDPSLIDAKSGTRNEFMKALGRKLDLTVTGFNAFRTDPQLKQIRTDLAERAEKTTFADARGQSFACPDPQLQTALRGVVRAIDGLPDLEKPKIAAVEGSEATIEAFRRLTATFYGALALKLPPSAEELRELQKKAVQSVEGASLAQRALGAETAGLSKRDYVPLAVAIFVDVCLLLVSMGRPVNRMGTLLPKMRAAERGPVFQILSRFSDIHRDAEVRRSFEIFRHVVFDHLGDYYVAVPLDAHEPGGAPAVAAGGQTVDAHVEAHLLANLFASFEKERIFTRVHSPFLGARQVRRKLRRQGSKFAGSQAFRVYKFRDGAWSDIILGAVMGAARRVEAEARSREALPRHDPRVEPVLPEPDAGSQAAGVADEAAASRAAPPRSAASARIEDIASRPRPASPRQAPAAAGRSGPQPLDPRHVQRFGRYAVHVPQTPDFEPPSDPAAHTAEPREAVAVASTPPPSADVIPLPGIRPFTAAPESVARARPATEATPTVEFSVSRETRTVSVPISEAALPAALLQALAATSRAELPPQPLHGDVSPGPSQVMLLSPPHANDEDDATDPLQVEADVAAIGRRFAPVPAE
jgi:hypothetical protein